MLFELAQLGYGRDSQSMSHTWEDNSDRHVFCIYAYKSQGKESNEQTHSTVHIILERLQIETTLNTRPN